MDLTLNNLVTVFKAQGAPVVLDTSNGKHVVLLQSGADIQDALRVIHHVLHSFGVVKLSTQTEGRQRVLRYGIDEENELFTLRYAPDPAHLTFKASDGHVFAQRETARIKGDDEYLWYRYTGPGIELPFRKSAHTLSRGDVFGVRYSSDGKRMRLVTERLGLTYVFTITQAAADHLRKNMVGGRR